jgi:ParB family chromosome partitioning protein
MAFTVSGDHERQEQVFERLYQSYDKQPYVIRRMLTEGAVRATDKRSRFVGIETYEAAGGTLLRDLFQGDEGGWLHDVALVDRLVAEKLKADSDAIAAEGWKWIEVAPDFPYGHTFGLRQLRGEPMALTPEEVAARDALQAEYDRLSEEYDGAEELPNEVDSRLGEIEVALEAFNDRPLAFDPSDIVRAGAFVSITQGGALRVERGYVRPEDELPVAAEPEEAAPTRAMAADIDADAEAITADVPQPEPEEDDGLTPISDRLMAELTAHRTLGLRNALGDQPDVAFLAALHALTLKVFYHYGTESCLELDLKSVAFGSQAPGLNDSASAQAIRVRHDGWAKVLPKDPAALWDELQGWEADGRSGLFAHVVSLSVNAVQEPWNRRPHAIAHADRLAGAVALDMAGAGWKPTVDNYLGRVTKARILQAVAEAKGQRATDRIEHLKKGDMAAQAEILLADTGWLPEPLRTSGMVGDENTAADTDESENGEDSPSEPGEGDPETESAAAE